MPWELGNGTSVEMLAAEMPKKFLLHARQCLNVFRRSGGNFRSNKDVVVVLGIQTKTVEVCSVKQTTNICEWYRDVGARRVATGSNKMQTAGVTTHVIFNVMAITLRESAISTGEMIVAVIEGVK